MVFGNVALQMPQDGVVAGRDGHNDVSDLGRGYDHFALLLQKIHCLLMFEPIPFDASG
jgi:hypothetical protein